MTAGSASKQQRLPAPERRERILQGALEVFSDRGYSASMGEIAAAAGVTRTVLYYYFPAKQDVFLAVLDSLLTELLRYVAPAVAAEGSLRERTRQAVSAIVAFVQANPRSWRLAFLREDTDPEVTEMLVRLEEMAKDAAMQLFAEEIAELDIDLDSVEMRIMAELGVGGAIQVMHWWGAHPDVDAERIEQAVFDLAWGGLRGVAKQ